MVFPRLAPYVPRKDETHKLFAKLICRQVNGTEGATANLLLDDILVDTVVRPPV